MHVVLQEVQDAADHQSGAAGLQGKEGMEKEGMEKEGVLVSSAGDVVGQAAATATSLRVDDSGPIDALRKAQQAAEAVAAAAQDVITAATQERVASAMRGLRQELESDDEGEARGSNQGAYKGATSGCGPARGG
jgi:hypothetical protein